MSILIDETTPVLVQGITGDKRCPSGTLPSNTVRLQRTAP
jgi:hypothetical protein